MIIDAILSRCDGEPYNAEEFCGYVYDEAAYWGFEELRRCAFSGTSDELKSALCGYIDSEGYNPEIKNYVNSVEW